jgi:hypothetical protein
MFQRHAFNLVQSKAAPLQALGELTSICHLSSVIFPVPAPSPLI